MQTNMFGKMTAFCMAFVFIIVVFFIDHYCAGYLISIGYLYFTSDSPSLTRIQTQDLRIGHVTLQNAKIATSKNVTYYLFVLIMLESKSFYRHLLLIKAWCCRADANTNAPVLRRRDISYSVLQYHALIRDTSR